MSNDKDAMIRDLAKEVVDDIEAGRLSAEGLILTGARLPTLTQIEEFQNWMNLESTVLAAMTLPCGEWNRRIESLLRRRNLPLLRDDLVHEVTESVVFAHLADGSVIG